MIENLTTRKNDILDEIDVLKKDAKNDRISVDELQQKTKILQGELEEIDKKEKLESSTKQLDMIHDQKAAAEHKYDDVLRFINRE